MIDARAAAPVISGDGSDHGVTIETLYRSHATRIYTVVYRIVGNHADAEELLQEVFLKAHRRRATFRHDAELSTWLYRVAVNRCLDFVRSRAARQTAVTTSLADEPPASARGTDRITRLDLERALAQLPDGYRTAFLLHDVEGYDHREVAELLGIAVGTSKSQVHKARLRLRRLLGRP